MSIDQQHEWLASPIGAYLQSQEQALFDAAVGDVFGFNALQVGMPQMDLLRNCRIPFSFKADIANGAVCCEASHLPFTSSSIDLLLLPHVLEFAPNPHQALREAERVLVPEGCIVLTGFNPLSSWGVRRRLARQRGYPWDGAFISLARIKDWLALLGFEPVLTQMACHALPFSHQRWRERFHCMDRAGQRWWPMMGGVYCVVAKKRVIGMRLIRPTWAKSRFKPRLVVAPSQQTGTQKSAKHNKLHE